MQKINQEIIKTISDFLEKNPEIRFTEMLHILDLVNSELMEKPQDTLRKINTKIKERCEVTKM
jgi:hypothetical protein